MRWNCCVEETMVCDLPESGGAQHDGLPPFCQRRAAAGLQSDVSLPARPVGAVLGALGPAGVFEGSGRAPLNEPWTPREKEGAERANASRGGATPHGTQNQSRNLSSAESSRRR